MRENRNGESNFSFPRQPWYFSGRRLTLADTLSLRFQIPAYADQAWQRIALGTGSSPDVDVVLRALGQLWAINSSDPRALEGWLSDLGINPKSASKEAVARAIGEFEKYQLAKRTETERLIQGATSSPNLPKMLAGLRPCPSEIKEVAYRQALKLCKDDNLVSTLAVFADENADVIQSFSNFLPPSRVTNNFCAYLKSRGLDCVVPDISILPSSDPRDPAGVEQLFGIITLAATGIRQRLAEIRHEDIDLLVKHVERLFPLLSEEGYGQFVRREMTLFICLAAPHNPIADNVVAMFTKDKDLKDAELIPFMGERPAAQILSNLIEKEEPTEPMLTAAFLDGVRKYYPEALPKLPPHKLAKLRKSRNPALALSMQAASLQLGLSDHEAFERSLLRSIKSDKTGAAASWLARNPEFLDFLPVHRLSVRTFMQILEAITKTDVTSALQFLRNAMRGDLDVADPRTWNAIVKALDRIDNGSSNDLFVEQTLRVLKNVPGHPERFLASEPTVSLLSRNIWAIARRTQDEKIWNIVFDAVTPKINEALVLDWLKAAPPGQNGLQSWLRNVYIPRLFERGVLSARFLVGLPDPRLQASFVNLLCTITSQRVGALQTLIAEWPSTRSAIKQKLAEKLSVGLRIAIRQIQNNEGLRARLLNLEASVQGWLVSESPRLDPAVLSVAEIVMPGAQPESKESLGVFFSRRLQTPHEISYMFALNPWAIDIYLSRPNTPWPKFEILADQIIKSLIYFARLNDRALALRQSLEEDIKIDLGIILREPLSEIEEMIAGFFVFRDILREIGLAEAVPALGCVVKADELSSDKHKFVRDPSQPGRLRLFGLGLSADGKIIGSARVQKSGDEDDRD